MVNPQLPCCFDENDEELLSLNEACKEKIIDRFQGIFRLPNSNQFVPLNEAMRLGFIIDIESECFTLYEVLRMRLYNLKENKLVHPVTSRPLSLKQAIVQDFVDPKISLVKNTNSGKYVPLSEALKVGLIDGNKNLYVVSETKKIPLPEALTEGLIVSSQKSLPLEKAIKMKLYRPETGKFVDPSTNTFNDLEKSIESGLINEDTTVFVNLSDNSEKPLVSAIADSNIDVTKGRVLDPKSKLSYNFDVAFEKGLLKTIPISYREKSVEKDILQTRIEPSASGKPRELSIEDTIKFGIINPESSYIKDPKTGKFILLKVYIQQNTLIMTTKTIIDVKSSFFVFGPKCVIYLNKPESFDELVDSNCLDLSTGKLSIAKQPELLSLKDGIAMGLLDPETVLIKDVAKNKLVRLNDATRKGLFDPERANVVDTKTSKLYNLEDAIAENLLKTPKKKFDLLEAIEYNLYNPTTGSFQDPFVIDDIIDRKKINLTEAIANGLVDPATTMVKNEANNEIISILSAINAEIIDPVNGRVHINRDNKKGETIDFVKARDKGLLVPAGQRVRNDAVGAFKFSVMARYIWISQNTLILMSLTLTNNP